MKVIKYAELTSLLVLLSICSHTYAARTVCYPPRNDLRQNEVVISSQTDIKGCSAYGVGQTTSYTVEVIGFAPERGLGEKLVCDGFRLPNGYTVKSRQFSPSCVDQKGAILVLNKAPLGKAFGFKTTINSSLSSAATTTDPDGDPLSYRAVSGGRSSLGGTFVVTNSTTGAFTYTPPSNKEGQDWLLIAVTDGKSDPISMQVYITIGAPVVGTTNQPPEFYYFPLIVERDYKINFMPSATDPENNTLVYKLDPNQSPEHGSVTQIQSSQGKLILTYEPVKGFTGNDSVYVTVSDGTTTVKGAYAITVAFVDDDGDGMANYWESIHGLNPNDPSDAFEDADGDQLTNHGEFVAGTSLIEADTDGDNLPDGYEAKNNNFNPIVADSQQDFDGDGYTNYEEYSDKTNPNMFADNRDHPMIAWLMPILYLKR